MYLGILDSLHCPWDKCEWVEMKGKKANARHWQGASGMEGIRGMLVLCVISGNGVQRHLGRG